MIPQSRLYEPLACPVAIHGQFRERRFPSLRKARPIAIDLADIVDDAVQQPLNVDFGRTTQGEAQ